MQTEEFYPIVGYEKEFLINKQGDILNIKEFIHSKTGTRKNHRYNTFVKHWKTIAGYVSVKLTKAGVEDSHFLHRLLAALFIPNPENKPHINHKNGIKDDNRLENLEWCTANENIAHAYENGLIKLNNRKGENHHRVKLSWPDVKEIRRVYKLGQLSQYKLALIYDVHRSTIKAIIEDKNWNYDEKETIHLK